MERAQLEEWVEDVTLEDLPEGFRPIAEVIGVEAAVRLSAALGGVPVYLPKLDRALQTIRDRRIVKEFNGGNYKELARRYDLSECRVREILNTERYAKAQMQLF